MAKKYPDTKWAGVDMNAPATSRAASRRTSRAWSSRRTRSATRSATSPRLMAKKDGKHHRQLRRRHPGPGGRPLHRGLPGGRQGGRAEHQRSSTATRRTSSARTSARTSPSDQISKGSDVVFQVAGGCGLGALDAAKEKAVWGIGVDADQAYVNKRVLTSAQKKVDIAVYTAIKQTCKAASSQGGKNIDLRRCERRRRPRQDQQGVPTGIRRRPGDREQGRRTAGSRRRRRARRTRTARPAITRGRAARPHLRPPFGAA